MNFSIIKDGKLLDPALYVWYKETRTLITRESKLFLDFSDMNGITFETGYGCIFKAGSYCTFKTGHSCNFNSSSNCIFNVGSNCIFDVASNCKFQTGNNCIFKVGSNCIFNTGNCCIFDVCPSIGSNCIFETEERCIITRRDTGEVIKIPKNIKIKLNGYEIKGYTIVELEREIIEVAGQKYYKDEVERRIRELKSI